MRESHWILIIPVSLIIEAHAVSGAEWLLNTCVDQMREGMEGTGTEDGPVALDRSDCPGFCFPICTTRTSVTRSAFLKLCFTTHKCLGRHNGYLKKKYSWQNVSWEMPYQD